MHPNPAFRGEPAERNLDFARERGFGVLSINSEPAPLISHIPFVLSEDGGFAELHLVRSNPIARAITSPTPAVIAVSGPDAYISPDWYEEADLVPTWNYTAIHLRGVLMPLEQEALRGALDRLAAHFEEQLLPKQPWTADKMSEEALARMMRMIQPFRFDIETVDGTWKLGQNKSDDARSKAAIGVKSSPIGQDAPLLAALMLGVPHEK